MLSPDTAPQGVKFLRVVEKVDGFFLGRFDVGGQSLGDLQFETMDEAMQYVYSEYREVSDWWLCPDDESPGRPPSRESGTH